MGEREAERARGPAGSYAAEVLEVVDAVPRGRVLTYGDVAELIGWGAARSVGAVLSRHGGAVPWWRVVRADGTVPDALLVRARERWAEEGVPVRPDRRGVLLESARWEGPPAGPPGGPGGAGSRPAGVSGVGGSLPA